MNQNLHGNHRERMRKRYMIEGADGFSSHELLEMLLYYCISRKDTNEMAHQLLNEFDNLPSVMSAEPKQLEKVAGIGESSAMFLRFLHDFNRYVMVRKKELDSKPLQSLDDCGEYLFPQFMGRRNEVVYILCLDSKAKVLSCKMLGEGSVNSAAVPIRRIVEHALNMNASAVVLAHNHPNGIALPSDEDVHTTRVLSNALIAVDVALLDHIIYSDDEFISMRQSNYFVGESVFGAL